MIEGDDYIFDIVQKKTKKGNNMFDSLSEKKGSDWDYVGAKKN